MTDMTTNLQLKQVKAQLVPLDHTIKAGVTYLVIYTREVTHVDKSSTVMVALQEYDLPVTEYPLSWFSIEDWTEVTS
jgi:hypothetical protein